MTYSFRPATREHAKLLIGLCGPSGSGKTLSALKLATGMGGKIAYIDTEGGRACQYADDFEFLHAGLEPPFHPDRYREIIDDAVKVKPEVIIIDSVSHVWEGPGGVLDMVDQAKKAGGNDFAVWAGPKQAHQKLVNRLIQLPAHVILCFRAKEKRGLVPDPDRRGKMTVVSLGWHPICEEKVVYELTVNCLLSSEKKGQPIIDGFDFGKLPYNMAHLLPAEEQVSEETGKRFSTWAKGGDNQPSLEPNPDLSSGDSVDDLDGNQADTPAITSAKELLAAIEAAPDLTRLAELDENYQTICGNFSDSTRAKLKAAVTSRMNALHEDAA